MKHTGRVIFVLVLLFLSSQIIGLLVVNQYGETGELPLNIERPETQESSSFVWIFFFVLIATLLALFLIKFSLLRIWRFWFLLSVFLTLTISFAAFMSEIIAVILAIILAFWKIFRPNIFIHNMTELFIYGALAVVFAPLMSLLGIVILLILISIYDYWAVRQTKHMVTMAKTQSAAKVFAGLMIPYEKHVAILGGGDMGFPLLFSAVVMNHFSLGLLNWQTYVVPICVTLMLVALFFKGDKKKYYPAMPYLTLGAFVGLGIIMLYFNIAG